MTTDAQEHWGRVYAEKDPLKVSWYQPAPERSLAIIRREFERTSGRGPGEGSRRVIDVGAGASTLVDHLLSMGVEVGALDVASRALEHSKARLGVRAAEVRWIVADLTAPLEAPEPNWADLWHDRAVFHFLSGHNHREAYARNLARTLRPGGSAVISGFAPEGPLKCSGLEVCRHDAESIRRELTRAGFPCVLVEEQRETHVTPWGSEQAFTYALLRRAE